PFRGFLHARAADPQSGPAWLFVGTRTFADLPYVGELREWVARQKLELRVAFSREPRRLTSVRGDPVAWPAPPGRVDALLDDDAGRAAIWHLLRSRADGGAEGSFYICGQAGFAHTVIQALKRVIARHGVEPDPMIRRMMAHGRLMLDV